MPTAPTRHAARTIRRHWPTACCTTARALSVAPVRLRCCVGRPARAARPLGAPAVPRSPRGRRVRRHPGRPRGAAPMPMAAFDPDADHGLRHHRRGGRGGRRHCSVERSGLSGAHPRDQPRGPLAVRPSQPDQGLSGRRRPSPIGCALRADSFYEAYGMERTHDRVTALDVASRSIELERRRR